ncbi:hypothetical protein [Edaphocola flava]|uniref:hypothetical protein n=1 Tax=Edaphocola flava TaxID=2499629 RepID=UPI00100A6FD7|nr:hypothetical protein [Edaphocola flava]
MMYLNSRSLSGYLNTSLLLKEYWSESSTVYNPSKYIQLLPSYDIYLAWAHLHKPKKQNWGGGELKRSIVLSYWIGLGPAYRTQGKSLTLAMPAAG